MTGLSWFSAWPARSSEPANRSASASPNGPAEAVESCVVPSDNTNEDDRKDDAPADTEEMSRTSTSLSRSSTPSTSNDSLQLAIREYTEQLQNLGATEYPSPPLHTIATTQPKIPTSQFVIVDPPVKPKAFDSPFPHPDAPLSEVREFLTAWFIYRYDLSEEEGLRTALKFEMDNQHRALRLNAGDLYACSEERIGDIFGRGPDLYDDLQLSKYGKLWNLWYMIRLPGIVLTGFAIVYNIRAAFNDDVRALLLWTTVGSIFHVALILVHRYCASETVVNSSKVPERLKARAWCTGRTGLERYFLVNMGLVVAIPVLFLLWELLALVLGWMWRPLRDWLVKIGVLEMRWCKRSESGGWSCVPLCVHEKNC